MQRGILGVKKDPKNPVLYFNSTTEEWPSDDSNDVDYKLKEKRGSRTKSPDGGDVEKGQACISKPKEKGRLVLKCRKVVSGKNKDAEKNNKHVKWRMESSNDEEVSESNKASVGDEPPETEKEKRDEAASDNDNDIENNPWGKRIPLEALTRIFDFVVREEGTIPCYQRMSRVCKLWCSVARHSSLWSRVDLSFPKVKLIESELESLCQERLSKTKEITLSGWKRQLTMNGIKAISNHCRNLTSINLSECTNVNLKAIKVLMDNCNKITALDLSHIAPSGGADSVICSESIGYIMSKCGDKLTHLNLAGNSMADMHNLQANEDWFPSLTSLNLSGCTKMNENTMRVLADKCPSLDTIDLSYTSNGGANNPCSCNSLRYVMSKCGACIVHLNMANNILRTFSGIFTILANSCHNLQVLDMSNVSNIDRSVISIPIEKLQERCPKLRVFRLTNVRTLLANTPLATQAQSTGFPDLEELSLAVINQEYHHGLDDSSLQRIVKTSNKLKLLDVRGCTRITASGLVRFPAFDLEYLFLSQCVAAMTPDIEIVMEKWRHSLVEVDLSWNNHSGEAVDAAVKSLARCPSKSILHTLNLSGSAVSYEPVKAVLKNCPNLAVLDLSSCRGLPRGIKRLYKGEDLQKFKMEEVEAL